MSGHFVNMRHGMAASLLMVTMATAASAQSVTDPTRVEFAPANAPNALDVRTGTPLVEKYTLDIYRAGSGTVVQRVDLGNPSPDPDGTIRVNFVALLPAPLPAGVVYESVVNVVGPVETVSSTRSETFAFGTTACTPAISPTSSVLSTWSATTGSIAVAANTSCSWTATSNASWLTITANAYGTGNATVSYSVAANTATTSRTGTMTVGGQTFSVSQAGTPACTFTISPATSTLSSSGATTGTVAVTTGTSCSWTATSNAAWITITGGAGGTGNGAVTYNVAANTGAAPRTGTLHHRRTKLFRDTARHVVCLGNLADVVDVVVVNRGKRSGDGDRTSGVQLDRDQQRRLDHGGRGNDWNRQWNGVLQRRRKHEQWIAHGNADDRWQPVHDYATRCGLRVHTLPVLVDPDVAGGDGWDGHGQQRRRLQLDRGEQRLVDHHHVGRQRSRNRRGELLGRIQHRNHIAYGDDDHRREDVHGDPAGDVVRLYDLPHQSSVPGRRWKRHRDGDDIRGLQLDGI